MDGRKSIATIILSGDASQKFGVSAEGAFDAQ
jgi:hypothetical protein